jgi:DNA mismatch endonuclease (patch repair protein)
MDTVNAITRSKIMASVGHENTRPEQVLRKALHRVGFRFILNDKRLPGSPDLVFRKYKSLIFVHGCFWHRHGCKYSTTPKTRVAFWTEKFKSNTRRDVRCIQKLKKLGWRIRVVWECQLKGEEKKVSRHIVSVSKWLRHGKTVT